MITNLSERQENIIGDLIINEYFKLENKLENTTDEFLRKKLERELESIYELMCIFRFPTLTLKKKSNE